MSSVPVPAKRPAFAYMPAVVAASVPSVTAIVAEAVYRPRRSRRVVTLRAGHRGPARRSHRMAASDIGRCRSAVRLATDAPSGDRGVVVLFGCGQQRRRDRRHAGECARGLRSPAEPPNAVSTPVPAKTSPRSVAARAPLYGDAAGH